MIELAAALRTVVSTLESADLSYIVVGSTAAAAWGVARTTRDVDVVVMTDDNLPDVVDAIGAAGLYVPESAARDAIAEDGSFNVLDPVSGGKVDLFVAGSDDAFTVSRLARRVRSDVLGVACWVATAEDVVLAKLRWRLESRSEVQWRDCTEIAAANDLDVDYLRRWGADLGVADDLEALIDGIDRAMRT